MTDDELIEAMARAIFSVIVEEAEFVPPKDDWKICIDEAKTALAVARPLIEERLWKRFEEMAKDLRAENEKLKDLNEDLTAVYLYGFEKGQDIMREKCARICEGNFDSEMKAYGAGFAAAIREGGNG